MNLPLSMPRRAAVLLLVLVGASGCARGLDTSYSYLPRPAEALLEQDAAAARTLVSVIGLYPADADTGAPAMLELRILIENTGARSLEFDPASILVRTGDLQTLPPAVTQTPGLRVIEPGEDHLTMASVPLLVERPEEVDLGTLDVSWALDVDGRAAANQVTLTRRRPVRYRSLYPYEGWGPRPGWYGPYGWSRYDWWYGNDRRRDCR